MKGRDPSFPARMNSAPATQANNTLGLDFLVEFTWFADHLTW